MSDETYLEVLHARAESHVRRFPRRPWRLYRQRREGGAVKCLGTYTTEFRAEAACALREVLDREIPPRNQTTGERIVYIYWVEEKR